MDTVRDSPLGQLLRWVTRDKFLLYPEEKPGFVFQKENTEQYHLEKSGSHPEGLARSKRNDPGDDSASSSTDANFDTERTRSAGGTCVVDWYGADDPSNPMNWSPSKKRIVAFQICLYTFVVYCGTSIYVPAEPQIMEYFHVGPTKASLGLALYVLGYGVGPLLFSPLSEIPACGRNLPYMSSFIIFVILCVPTALVDNYAGLMVLRFLQGFFGSPCLASGGASMADMYADIDIPLALTGWVAAAYGGPALGPLLSAYSINAEGWRWALWEILWMSGPVLILMLVFLPETSTDTILLRRAQRLRRITQNPNIHSPSEIAQGNQSVGAMMTDSLIKPIEIMAKDPAILFTNLYTSLVYGIYYSFFEAFPLVYPALYGFSSGQSGLIFVSLAVSCGLGMVVYIIYLYTYLIPDLKKNGHRDQEHRLVPALVASIFPPAGLALFAWTSRPSIHWMVGVVGILFYGAAVFIIFQCIFVYIPLAYPRYAASLFAGNDFSRSALAFAFILFSRHMFINLGVDKGVTLLAGLSVLGILGMIGLYFYGAKLRAQSKFTESKDC